MRIVSGSTQPGNTNWVDYDPNGIYVDIDTSSARFTETPRYFASLGGDGYHWSTTGATSIYDASPTGFRIYVYKDPTFFQENEEMGPEYANRHKWHINWLAVAG